MPLCNVSSFSELRALPELTGALWQIYTSVLALVTLTARPTAAELASTHLSLLLWTAFAVVTYRDLFPLGTFAMARDDSASEWLTWLRVALLSISGVVIPICTPSRYTPVDPSVSYIVKRPIDCSTDQIWRTEPQRAESRADRVVPVLRAHVLPGSLHLQGVSRTRPC